MESLFHRVKHPRNWIELEMEKKGRGREEIDRNGDEEKGRGR